MSEKFLQTKHLEKYLEGFRVNNNTKTTHISTKTPNHWDLDAPKIYARWRENKLRQSQEMANAESLVIRDLAKPDENEMRALIESCAKTNMALYEAPNAADQHPDDTRLALRSFSEQMDLKIAEDHRSAGKNGVVALTVSQAPSQRGYLPYSQRPMNWHTDGYYNAPDQQIRAMVLHCVNPARSGGQNQFLDCEIAYIRLRDHNPAFIHALMHPQAMTIPENKTDDGEFRPASIGPVFSVDKNNHLAMRYTARTRSIAWRQDEDTQAAVRFLQNLLENGDPFTKTATLKAGQGILCNNSLHNRTGFDPEKDRSSDRLMFRIRFHNRVKGT